MGPICGFQSVGTMRWYQNVVISAWVSVCGFPSVGIRVWVSVSGYFGRLGATRLIKCLNFRRVGATRPEKRRNFMGLGATMPGRAPPPVQKNARITDIFGTPG